MAIQRAVLFLFLFVGLTCAINFRDLPPQLTGFYPKKLAQFYSGITETQEKTIDEAIMSNTTDREAQYAAIKKKDSVLEAKFRPINEEFVGNLSSLSFYANSFYYFRILQRLELLQQPGVTEDQLNEFAADVIQEWSALNNETQKEIRDKFPDIVETIQSSQLQGFAEKAPYIKPYLTYLIQKWDFIPAPIRLHLTKELPELAQALNSVKVRAYVNQAQPLHSQTAEIIQN